MKILFENEFIIINRETKSLDKTIFSSDHTVEEKYAINPRKRKHFIYNNWYVTLKY